ncbi:hypothetical protein EDD85DRAFT_976034 [Armillaria nabsnona]|nr:hypothetical protein EDD85DRAFT_976034 [Armillaria nabsnona]
MSSMRGSPSRNAPEHVRHHPPSVTRATRDSMVVSEPVHAARLANTCPALQRVVFPNGVQWRSPSPSPPPLPQSRPSPCLPFNDIFVKKIDRNAFPPPLPPRKVVPLTEQRFMKAAQCFDLNESDDDDDSLFFKPSPMKESSSMQRCHEQVEVNFKGLERW